MKWDEQALGARLARQLRFVVELDQLKLVLRRSYVAGGERLENSAEHSWHLAMLALVLAEHADEPVDVARVIELVLVHDVVEIDTGDTFLYDEAGREAQVQAERAAAERIFGLLPDEQAARLLARYSEFEAGETPEARFARALDRLMPLLHNLRAEGRTWSDHGIRKEQVLEKNATIARGSKRLWAAARRFIEQADREGLFPRARPD